MITDAEREAKKRYMARLKLEDPDRYRRYKSKGRRTKIGPIIPLVYDQAIVAANKAKRRSRIEHVRLKRVKKFLVFIKEHFKCIKCSESYVGCLDFHHVDQSSKINDMSKILHNGSIKKLIEEMLKCVVLCANCHRKVHGGILTVIEPTIDAVVLNDLKDEFIKKHHPTYIGYLKIQNDMQGLASI